MDRTNVVVYDPITAALFLNGGMGIVFVVLVAAGLALWLLSALTGGSTYVSRQDRWHKRHAVKIAGAVFVALLVLAHFATVNGWLQ